MPLDDIPLPLFNPWAKTLDWVSVIALGVVAAWAMVQGSKDSRVNRNVAGDVNIEANNNAANVKPALTAAAITPQMTEWPRVLVTNGNIAAWQEAVISTEVSNLLLTDVRVNVGDRVKKGQVLARIANETVAAELSEAKASVAEAEAMLSEARANGERARRYQQTGFLSAQQINQYLTAEKTALARLNAARARMQTEQLRLAQTRVRAPDDGVISARTATPGSLAQPGQELFRLIRGSRSRQAEAGDGRDTDHTRWCPGARPLTHGRADRRPADAPLPGRLETPSRRYCCSSC